MHKARSISAAIAVAFAAATLMGGARAETYNFDFAGPGVSGALTLTYGAAADAKYPDAYEVTGISGTFTDTNKGLNIVNATIGSLVPITHDAPEPTNLLAPNDFSRYSVASGLLHGNSLSFDNLVYPGGSPQTATDYDGHGGFLDIYGLLFNIGGGKVVNLWSNGDFGSGVADFGVAVVTSAKALDYVDSAVAPVPEPSTLCLFGAGLLALVGYQRRRNTPR